MDSYFKKAIDILASDNDWKQICAKFAKDDPKRFCEVVLGPEDWEQEVLDIFHNNKEGSRGTLAAIEFARTYHRCSLSEARNIVNTVIATKS